MLAALRGSDPRDSVSATGPDATALGIDMMTDDGANTATGLGAIEGCREVPNVAGIQFTIDVWLDAVPSGWDLDAFNYQLHFMPALALVGQAHDFMLPAPPSIDLSEAVPDPPGSDSPAGSPHNVVVANLGEGWPAPAGTVGVLGRYTMEVTPFAQSAAYAFMLDQTPGLLTFAGTGGEWTNLISEIRDGGFNPTFGVVALGVPCGTTVTTPTPKPTPRPTPTPDVGLRGDVNCSGEVDAVDALLVLRRVAEMSPFAVCITAGNVKCNDDIDSVDALMILQHVAELAVNLPSGCPPIG